MKTTLLDLWRESTIIQGLLALCTGGTICYMVIAGMELPAVITSIFGTIIGFYFGTKTAKRSA